MAITKPSLSMFDSKLHGDDDSSQDISLYHPEKDSPWRRWILFAFAVACCGLVAGVIYGWPSLRRQLLKDGSTLTEEQFAAIYTAATWSSQGGRAFTGLARDRYGTKLVGCLGLGFALAGSLGIALSDPSNALALGISLFVLSLGSGIMLVVQPVGSLFPFCSNVIMTTLSGSFQVGGGLTFLILTLLPMSTRNAFVTYSSMVAALMVMAGVLLPMSPSFVRQPQRKTTTKAPPGFEEDISGQTLEESESFDDYDGDCATVTPSFTKLQQIVSTEYLLLLVWFSVGIIPCQYYVGSIGFQLEVLGDDDGYYSSLFSVIYAASAVAAPAGGYLSDRFGLGITQGLANVLVSLSLFILGLGTKVPLKAHTASMILYGVGCVILSGMFFSNIGRRFGYTHFGTLSGFGLLVCATIANVQYPMITLASNGYASLVNFVAGGVLLISMTPYCVWLSLTERRHEFAQSLLIKDEEKEEPMEESTREELPAVDKQASPIESNPIFRVESIAHGQVNASAATATAVDEERPCNAIEEAFTAVEVLIVEDQTKEP